MSSDGDEPTQFPRVFGLRQLPPDPELAAWFANLCEENDAPGDQP